MRALDPRSSNAVHLMLRMCTDMEPVFGMPPGPQHIDVFLDELARLDFSRAYNVACAATAMSAEAWHALLGRAPARVVRSIVARIRADGLETEQTFALRLRPHAAFRESEAALLQEMQERGVQPGAAWEIEVARRRLQDGDVDGAATAADALGDFEDDRLAGRAMNVRLAVAVARRDLDALRRVIAAGIDRGLQPPLFALRAIVDDRLSRSCASEHDIYQAVEAVEAVLGRDAGSMVWAVAIESFLTRSPSAGVVSAAYTEARGRSVPAERSLAATVIGALVTADPPQLDAAMAVYADHEAHLRAEGDSPYQSLYQTLLAACAHTGSTTTAVLLTEDLRAHRLGLPRHLTREFILDLMRSAADHESAFAAYSALAACTRLDKDDYADIASTYISLSTPASLLPPADLVLDLMADMRRAGFSPGPEVLTALLARYSAVGAEGRARKASKSAAHHAALSATVVSAVRDIHTLLRLDPGLVTDVTLLTALMNAYSFWGATDDALAVWDELVERRPRELAASSRAAVAAAYGPAVSVVLDACGHARMPVRARKAWKWAHRHGLVNARHWAAWVECLARCGLMDEAVRVVCEDMGVAGALEPTKDVAAILLKFSWANGDVRRVSERVRERFPQWWHELKRLVETRSTKE
ncbi:hypothetical protein Q5752_005122 [Cryptotrichosporon argae]